MDVMSLIPTSEVIPVDWIWLQAFLLLTTFLHMLAMNVTLGTGFIAFVGPLTGWGDVAASRSLARTIPYSLALTINFGVAPLLFLQTLYGQFFYTSTVLMAVYWLSIVLLIIISYYLVYIYNYQFANIGHQSLLLAIPVAAFFLVAFFYVNNISIMQNPAGWPRYFSGQSGMLLNLADPTMLPRYLHAIFSALAVGGLSLAILSDRDKGLGALEKTGRIDAGCKWFTYSTVINFGIGFWFLGSLPAGIIITSVPSGLAFYLLIILAAAATFIAAISAMTGRIYRAAGWTAGVILLMVMAREILRSSYLRDYINLAELKVNPEYGPLMIFLVVLVLGIWLVWWMLKRVDLEMGGEA